MRTRRARTVRVLIQATIRWSGIPWLLRETVARNKVSILLYHDPDPEDFRRQISYLARCYTFITLETLVAAIANQDWSSIPSKSLVVSFDDGHRQNAELLETCREFGVVPTIYLCSGIVGTNRHFWWMEAPDDECQALKWCPSQTMEAILEARHGFTFRREYESRQALSLEELERMKPYVDFEAHARFHRILPLATLAERHEEIDLPKAEIEELTECPCEHFSFPNGTYTETELELVRQAGYRSARTIDFGWNDLRTDPFRLKIAGAPERGSANAAASSPIVMYLRLALRGSFSGRHRASMKSKRSARRLVAGSGGGTMSSSPTSSTGVRWRRADRSPEPAIGSRESPPPARRQGTGP